MLWRRFLLTDRSLLSGDRSLADIVARGLASWGGPEVAVWLREKDLPAGPLFRLAEEVGRRCREAGAGFVVGDRPDVAVAAGADGVQLGELGLPVEAARRAAPGLLIGRSVHDAPGVAGAQGADWLVLAPVRDVPGKPGLGWTRWRELAMASQRPVVALGGLRAEDEVDARRHGAFGIALRRGWLLALPLFTLGCPGGSDDTSPDDDPAADDDVSDDDSAGDYDSAAPPVPLPVPGDPAILCASIEPDEGPQPLGSLVLPDPPWDGATECGEAPAGPLPAMLSGRIDLVIAGGWDGDADVFRLAFAPPGPTRAVLQWDPLRGDLDARVVCQSGEAWVQPWRGDLANADLPEVAQATAPVAGECWVFVAGYDGGPADYLLWFDDTL
jgi:thiamine-phosphate pyrophosphorylase